MSVRLYKITWLILLGIIAVTYLAGSLTTVGGVMFGFIIFGLIFMGMIAVLPASMAHPADVVTGPGLFKRAGILFGKLRGRVHETGRSWMSTGSVEVHHQKYH